MSSIVESSLVLIACSVTRATLLSPSPPRLVVLLCSPPGAALQEEEEDEEDEEDEEEEEEPAEEEEVFAAPPLPVVVVFSGLIISLIKSRICIIMASMMHVRTSGRVDEDVGNLNEPIHRLGS